MTLTEFHNKYGNRILAIMQKFGLSYDDACDCRQELYKSFIKNKYKIGPHISSKFLVLISRRKANAYKRLLHYKHSKEAVSLLNVEQEDQSIELSEVTVGDWLNGCKYKHKLNFAIEHAKKYKVLKTLCMWDILKLKIEGLTETQIGEVYGVSRVWIGIVINKWRKICLLEMNKEKII